MPVAYFSKKLTPTQRHYSTIEQEMLAIVEVLEEYRNFLIGADIIIYTDHKNLLASSTINDRVFRWKQKIQEYNPVIKYIKGHKNTEADALSRLPILSTQDGIETMLNHPPVDPYNPILNTNPLELSTVHSHQQRDAALLRALREDSRFSMTKTYKQDIIVYQVPGSQRRAIVIPQILQYPTIRWLHSILGHAGNTRLLATITSHFWFPQMKQMIIDYVKKCSYCQKYNKQIQKYGQLPPKNIEHLSPWDEVCVDLIGPWKIVINQFEYHFRALTCIDPIINLPEIIPINNATSREVANAFEDHWLSRYPLPQRYIHDNGNEFLGWEFTFMLKKNNIKSVPTTVKNPQSNAMVERMHQSISTMLAISIQENPPKGFEEAANLVQRKCMDTQFSLRATVHSTMKLSPGELAFGRNMLNPFSTQINWDELLKRKQETIDKYDFKENSKRLDFDYKIGDKVLILNKATFRNKLDPSTLPEGPWEIKQVHANGTVSIQRNNYLERMNIRRLRPFFM